MYHPFFPSQIGKQTADQSKDEKLKKDMPPAIAAIQEATKLSAEASEGLSGEEQSAADKKKLLDGSSGKRELGISGSFTGTCRPPLFIDNMPVGDVIE